jgi:hypothetical protein
LTSALVGGEWLASWPDRVIPGEIATVTHSKGSWVGPRAGLDEVEKGKFLTLSGLELQFVASRYTDWAILGPLITYSSMNQSPAYDADSLSADQEFLRLLRNRRVNYSVHNSLPVDPTLR